MERICDAGKKEQMMLMTQWNTSARNTVLLNLCLYCLLFGMLRFSKCLVQLVSDLDTIEHHCLSI